MVANWNWNCIYIYIYSILNFNKAWTWRKRLQGSVCHNHAGRSHLATTISFGVTCLWGTWSHNLYNGSSKDVFYWYNISFWCSAWPQLVNSPTNNLLARTISISPNRWKNMEKDINNGQTKRSATLKFVECLLHLSPEHCLAGVLCLCIDDTEREIWAMTAMKQLNSNYK